MRQTATLITGASGEMGHGLIRRLAEEGVEDLVALDIRPIDSGTGSQCKACVNGDILDERLLERIQSEYEIHTVYHLAALLSTRAEFTPDAAHRVNAGGTPRLLQMAVEQSHWHGRPVKFMFPSSIAAYGLPGREVKQHTGRVRETEWNFPTTMYGCNKLYCEHLGRYYANHYRQLAADSSGHGIDFRCIRFPGLISAVTLPSGGTTDYAVEIFHAALDRSRYTCPLKPDTRMDMMYMADAIRAIIELMEAPSASLVHRNAFNVTALQFTPAELADAIRVHVPAFAIDYEPDPVRQAIADSWPERLDDSEAREQWGWRHEYELPDMVADMFRGLRTNLARHAAGAAGMMPVGMVR